MLADPKRVETIFHAALAVAPADRAALLAAQCGPDAGLRDRVERLLAAQAELDASRGTADFAPNRPTATFGEGEPATADHTPRPDAGNVLAGRYKLIEEIGEGGMGTVWLAEQNQPVRRRVAVKLIKSGMDSKAVLARFEAERQALALMDHPNIARVLDAGAAPDGRPFFVMELVKGVPVTEFCDHHRLTPRERLELFVPVCQAIQHAHQKGVIHRDVKPNNVLVALYDDRAVPKVIDFGVAKAAGQALTDKTLATGFGAVVGTPEYMSPEQASFNNLDIDTRSDVYALGALLYELLAGSPPFSRKELEKAGLLEIFRVIREQEPPRPSTKLSTAEALPTLSTNRGTEPAKLTRLLRGELDWIVMKALEKDRSRRYETANAFAADVQRHLAGEPVQAVPPSAGYRLRKFLRKNRAAVLTAAAFAGLLVAGAVTSAGFAVQARFHADLSKRNEAAANDAKDEANRNAALAADNERLARAETGRVRGMLYAANFGLIQDALRDQRIGRVRQLLRETTPKPGEPDLRGFEWYFVDREVNGLARDIDQMHHWAGGLDLHSTTPALSRDGRWASMVDYAKNGKHHGAENADRNDPFAPATSNLWDHDLKVWDVATGREVFTLQRTIPMSYTAHQSIVSSGHIAWASRRTVTIYDPATKKQEDSITLEGHITDLRFDRTGRRLAALTWIHEPKNVPKGGHPRDELARLVEVWDTARKERLLRIGRDGEWVPAKIEMAPDGSRLAVQSIWDGGDGSKQATVQDNNQVLSRIAVWDLNSGKKTLDLPTKHAILPAGAFHHDSRQIALGDGKMVSLFDSVTGEGVRGFGPVGANVSAVAVSPDGRTLAVGDASATITLFKLASRKPSGRLLGHEQPIRVLAFRGNDTLVSICRQGLLKEWNLAPPRAAATALVLPGEHLAADPTGRYALCGEPAPADPRPRFDRTFREVVVWDVASGRPKEVFRKPLAIPGTSFPANRPGVVFSPDGRRVCVTYSESPPWRFGAHRPQDVGSLLPTPVDWSGGLARASFGWAQKLPILSRTVIWDVPTGNVVLDLPQSSGVGFSRDGRFILLGPQRDSRIPWTPRATEPRALWDLAAPPPRRVPLEEPTLPAAPDVRVARIEAFGPGDRYMTAYAKVERHEPMNSPVTTGVHLFRWDLETGRLVFSRSLPAPLPEHCNVYLWSDCNRVVLTPQIDDGRMFSKNPELGIWDIEPTGEFVSRLRQKGKDAEWLAGRDEGETSDIPDLEVGFTPDEKWLMVFAPRQARLWRRDALTDQPITLRGVRGWPLLMAVSEDGRRLVAISNTSPAGSPAPEHVLKVWDLTSEQELLAFSLGSSIGGFDPSRRFQTFDGKLVKLYPGTAQNDPILFDGSPRRAPP